MQVSWLALLVHSADGGLAEVIVPIDSDQTGMTDRIFPTEMTAQIFPTGMTDLTFQTEMTKTIKTTRTTRMTRMTKTTREMEASKETGKGTLKRDKSST